MKKKEDKVSIWLYYLAWAMGIIALIALLYGIIKSLTG